MSYCINPACPQPQNPNKVVNCQACGSQLLLRDRYQIIQPLGKGGFGATFLSKDLSLPGKPICVIKELRPSTTTPGVLEMARQLFEREAETLGKIGHHPQIPRLLGYFEWNKHFYLVQEYVSGSTLKQEVKKQGLFTEAQVNKFLIEILPVIDYIHSQKVIHRDIKPANIIRRSQDGHLVLIDFGAVKDKVNQTTIVGGGTGETAFTKISIGTSGFAPPEQMALRPVYASDIYALGITCIYLLTGKSPNSLGYDQINGEILWRSLVDVSDSFGKLLEKMLEASVRHRFQSAEELLKVLNNQKVQQKQNIPAEETNSVNTVFRDEPTVFEGEGVSWTSPASKIAQKIRERNTRLEQTSVAQPRRNSLKMKQQMTQGYLTTVSPTNQKTKLSGKASEKWTAAKFRSAYAKGRRDFADCNLSRLNLRKAKLSGANFYGANLHQTNLLGANLSDANLGHCNLTNTILKDANLTQAYLSTASLEDSDLQGADLTKAYLNGANLRGANLCGANLTNAMVNDRQIEMAKTNWRTIMPDGKRGNGF
ncbi:MAG: serine/threonine-protein kinase [Microcoleaceae cyanobacterium]